MGSNWFLNALDISGSGMSAERFRMNIIAQNIANAHVTRSAEGGPYRRKEVIFRTILKEGLESEGGVEVLKIVEDNSSFIPVYRPGHPDADEKGYVLMPNVNVTFEMVDLITAARAYEANLLAAKSFQEMILHTLNLGK